eukprot:g581.t1
MDGGPLGPRVCCFGWGDDGRCAFDVNEAVQIQQEEESGEGSDSAVRRAASRAGARRRRKMAKDDGPAGEGTDARMRKLVTDPHVVTSLMGRAVQGEVCEVACGAKHTLICTTRGKAFSFGSNEFSQLGSGNELAKRKATHTPVPVQTIAGAGGYISHVYAGGFSSYALSGEGKIYSWGSNSHGQLGIATAPKRKKKKKKAEMTKEEKAKLDNRRGSWRAKLQAQKDAHKGIIAKPESEDDEEEHPLDADGPAAALAATARMMATPTLVHSIEKKRVRTVAAGHRHVLVLMVGGGQLYTWGFNRYGQLGLEDTIDRPYPECMNSMRPIKCSSIAAGRHFSIAVGDTTSHLFLGNKASSRLRRAGESKRVVVGWGENDWGQLCLPATRGKSVMRPTVSKAASIWDPPRGDAVMTVYAGGFHIILLMKSQLLLSCGNNRYGQLGLGDMYDRDFPMKVPEINFVTDISAGDRHTLASTSHGILWAWGFNVSGELGVGNKSMYLAPEPISRGIMRELRPTFISAGKCHSAIIATDMPDETKPMFRGGDKHSSMLLDKTALTVTHKMAAEEDEDVDAVAINEDDGMHFIHAAIANPAVTKGKFRWDIKINSVDDASDVPAAVGVCKSSIDLEMDPEFQFGVWAYMCTGEKVSGDTGRESFKEEWSWGDIIGVEVDRDIGYVRFYKNDVDQGIAFYEDWDKKTDIFLYVGLANPDESVTLLSEEPLQSKDDIAGDEDRLICATMDNESVSVAPLEVYFECNSCKVIICRACAYQCHNGHSVGLVISYGGSSQCACTRTKTKGFCCLSLPKDGPIGGARRRKKKKKKKIPKYSYCPPSKVTFKKIINTPDPDPKDGKKK